MTAIPSAIVMASLVNMRARNPELRQYARWEYGTNDPAFLIASARRHLRTKPKPTLAKRLKYWLNSFRGFAAFDVRGVDDRVRD